MFRGKALIAALALGIFLITAFADLIVIYAQEDVIRFDFDDEPPDWDLGGAGIDNGMLYLNAGDEAFYRPEVQVTRIAMAVNEIAIGLNVFSVAYGWRGNRGYRVRVYSGFASGNQLDANIQASAASITLIAPNGQRVESTNIESLAQKYLELEILIDGNRHQVIANNQVVLDYTHNRPVPEGRVGLIGAGNTRTSTFEYFEIAFAPESQPAPVLEIINPSGISQTKNGVNLRLRGRGFQDDATVNVNIPGAEVTMVTVQNENTIMARLAFPDNIPAGKYNVTVTNPDGQSSTLPDAFEVAAAAVPIGPSDKGGEGNIVNKALLAAGAIILGAAGFVVGRLFRPKIKLSGEKRAERKWELDAETDLPEARSECQWTCQAGAKTELMKWQAKSLRIIPMKLDNYPDLKEKEISGNDLDSINDIKLIQTLLKSNEKLQEHVRPLAKSIVEKVDEYREESISPASFNLSLKIAREIECEFKLLHAEPEDNALEWVERKKWTRSVHQPGDEDLGVFLGPRAGEANFEERLMSQLEIRLASLLKRLKMKI